MANQLHEGPVLAAWEVDQLDEMWLETLLGAARKRKEEDNLRRHQAATANAKNAWRQAYYRNR